MFDNKKSKTPRPERPKDKGVDPGKKETSVSMANTYKLVIEIPALDRYTDFLIDKMKEFTDDR